MSWVSKFPYKQARPVQTDLLAELESKWDAYDVFVISAPTACHAPGQKVIKYDGTAIAVEDVKVGDILLGPDSAPRNVLKLHNGFSSEMREIVPTWGASWIVTPDHILSMYVLKEHGERSARKEGRRWYSEYVTMSVKEFEQQSKYFKHRSKLWKPPALTFSSSTTIAQLPINPYILGLWLGDGSSRNPAITTMDKEVVDVWRQWTDELGLSLRVHTKMNNKASTYTISRGREGRRTNTALELLRNLTVINNKHIPTSYLTASVSDRLELLAGLMDTDGNFNPKQCNAEITQVRKELANNIIFLVRSLGFSARMSTRVIKGKNYYRITFSGELTSIPLRIKRKQTAVNSTRNMKQLSFEVMKAPGSKYYGFELDGDHLYLLDDFTVTHNSGKSAIAETLARVHRDVAYLAPTNQLLKQYLSEFPKTQTLHRLDSYNCSKWLRPCSVTRGKLGSFCSSREGINCAASNDIRKCKFQRGSIAVNYHTYLAHKLYRSALILDEAHNSLHMIRDRFAVTLWMHDYHYPSNMHSVEQIRKWLSTLTPNVRKHRKIQLLIDSVEAVKPQYIPLRSEEEFNGKGTTRGLPELRDCLKLLPTDISEHSEIFWPRGEVRKVILLSATISRKDVEQLGLLGVNRKRVCYIECASPIPAVNRPVYPVNLLSVNRYNLDEACRTLAKFVHENHDWKEKGVIHCTYQMSGILSKYLNGKNCVYHTQEDKLEQYEHFRKLPADSGAILIACGMYEGIDLPEDLGRWQIISKIPWPSLGNPAIAYQAAQDPEWYIWETLKVVIQACGRVCRTETDYGSTYIIDSTWKKLYDDASEAKLIPKWFAEAIVNE